MPRWPVSSYKEKPCRRCGSVFKPTGSNHYCSDLCKEEQKIEGNRRSVKKYRERKYGTRVDTKDCSVCGSKFQSFGKAARFTLTCSKECSNVLFDKKQVRSDLRVKNGVKPTEDIVELSYAIRMLNREIKKAPN